MPSTSTPRDSGFWGVLLFGTGVFAGGFLIFLVQPMVGKRIVPWFGGTPGVWTLCLAFYQSALFLGYAYAHLLIARFSPIRQLGIHALLFAIAFAVLPVLPGEAWKPLDSAEPSAQILAMLAANVALPFLLLAATGPLLQSWFASAYPGRSPYSLYALSNFGSMLALLAYPFIIEPRVSLSLNSDLWSWGFALAGVVVLSCSWLALQRGAGTLPASLGTDPLSVAAAPVRSDAVRRVLWFSLPACAVVIFMGVTNELCRDVASVPFLWILPLCTYLLTFILCFASARLYPRVALVGLALVLLVTFVALGDQSPLSAPGSRSNTSLYSQVAGYTLLLFVCCMFLHGELYRLRPPPESLTTYYLYISGGGAAGGLFVGLLAPGIFTNYSEFPLGLAAGGILILVAWWRDPTSLLRVGRFRRAWVGAACASVVALLIQVVLQVGGWGEGQESIVQQRRNFYGVLRVVNQRMWQPPQNQVLLRNGTTGHGFQLIDDDLRSTPTDYYSLISAIGIALSQPSPASGRKVGVIGLGVGTLAAYGRKGDHFKFYEIDHDVVELARDAGYFSYLSDSQAKIEIVEGDARLSLESELRDGGGEAYDVLVLDAFSSDSIPIHLLTREAFELYGRHLRDEGLLAVHVSTVHLTLSPLVGRLGQSTGLHALFVASGRSNRYFSRGSRWVLLSRKASTLESFKTFALAQRDRLGLRHQALRMFSPSPETLADAPLWTDDYSDVFGVLKKKSLF